MSPIENNGQQCRVISLRRKQEIALGIIRISALVMTFSFLGNFEGGVAQAQVVQSSGIDMVKSLITSDAKDILTLKGHDASPNPLLTNTQPCENTSDAQLERKLYATLGNSPMKEMVPYMAKKDAKVAGLLVGIAKIESGFGVASPSREGKTCYNYWGYKSSGSRGQAMGYACFGSAEEAVSTVGGRIETLVQKKLDTPAKMIVWKCGSSCSGHDSVSVQRWIGNVSDYFNKIVQG